MKEYRYHPEIEGLKVNEDGSEVFLNEVPQSIKIRKNGKNPYRFYYYKGNQIALARLVLECFEGMPPKPKSTAKHIDGNYSNYHYTNLHWGDIGGNSKYPSKLNAEQKKEVLIKIANGIGYSEIAKLYGVSRNAIFNLRKKENNGT